MTVLFGMTHDAVSLAERAGALAQFGGVRLMTVEDGAGRGVRVLEFNTGSGLRFSVTVDRAMDIAEVSHNGRPIGWQSASGIRHPALTHAEEEGGLGWNRSFNGFLATCGLDHILGPEEVPAETYRYPRRATVPQGLHGRIANTPARLTGYGEIWQGDRCILWAEGIVIQATLFGENLHLHRRIEADLGGNVVRLSDRVVNAGFARTPHMLMYHVNLGYPVIDDGARLLAPVGEPIFATHAKAGLAAQGVGYRTCPPPRRDWTEQVWEHDTTSDAEGRVPVAVVNDRLGFGIQIETAKTELPCLLQWQNFQSGNYVMGIEAATHHLPGNTFARERDEMIWLDAGEARSYHAEFRVLDGAADIAGAEARIAAIQRQPETDYPDPTGRFPPLYSAKDGAS